MAERALATAFVNLVPGTKDIDTYLKNKLGDDAGVAGDNAGKKMGSGMGNSFLSTFKNIAGAAGIGLGVAGIATFFKDAITNASDFNEQGAAVAQVFGSAQGSIQKFAASGATALGQSKVQVLDAAKSFGIYGEAAGLAGEDNAKFSTNLVGLATDLASFNNTSVDEAIQALGSGLRGEAEPLRKYGVLLDDATLKAKAMTMGLYDGDGPLNQQAKVLAANAVILEQTSTQQGDFARTSGGLANQQRILAAQTEDLGIKVGSALLPTLTKLATFANKNLVPALTAIGSFFGDNIVPIGVFAGVLGALTLALNLQAIATAISTSAWWANAAAMLANPMTWIVLGIAAIVAALVWVATKTTFFQDTWKIMSDFVTAAITNVGKWFNDTWNGIVSFFKTVGDKLKAGWDTVAKWFQDGFNSVGKWFSGIWEGAKTAWNTFSGFIMGAADKVKTKFNQVFQGIQDFIGDIFQGLVGLIRGPLNSVISFMNRIIDKINGFSFTVPDWVPGIGGQTIGFNLPHIPALAAGGFVTGPTTALIGEAGPEVVTPLKDFERMMGIDGRGKGPTIIYNAAPNESLSSEQQLVNAVHRAGILAW